VGGREGGRSMERKRGERVRGERKGRRDMQKEGEEEK
jgi:hypothetical protein